MSDMTDLTRQMAEVYIKTVRDLESRIRELESENTSLRIIISELREATDTYYEGETHNHV